jgi:hypothetical protein
LWDVRGRWRKENRTESSRRDTHGEGKAIEAEDTVGSAVIVDT